MPPAPAPSPLALRWLTLAEVQALPPLPSGYVTDRVLQLTRTTEGDGEQWALHEATLDVPLSKSYDRGGADEWLGSYLEEHGPARLHFLVAERAGELRGLLACRQLDWNHTLWLLDIRVRESERRSGIGSALIGELKTHARGLSLRGILVETQTTNVPAIRFYEKHGFVICGFNDHLYGNDDLANQEVALYLFCELEDCGGS